MTIKKPILDLYVRRIGQVSLQQLAALAGPVALCPILTDSLPFGNLSKFYLIYNI